MNKYMKLSLLLCNIIFASVLAQEIEVPSLRSLALDKSAELLHKELVKPQSAAQRKSILDYCENKAGILFKQPVESSNLCNQTILERFEQKYATQLKKITEFDGLIADISHDGTKCCFRTGAKSLCIADINTGQCLHTLKGHRLCVNHVALTTDNTKAISASHDKTLKVWDLNNGQCLHTLQGHTDSVNHVTLTTDNIKAISASWDNTLKVWDINTGQCLQTIDTYKSLDALIHKSLVAVGTSIYRFEDYQSVIDAMPQPKPGSKINNPARLIDLTKTGAAAGFAKLQALKHKNIAMGLAHRS